jgi:tetratricopeptide (TPR) repeat protein
LSLQHGEHHYYGRGAEKYLWTLQHYHAMRFALSQKDDATAATEALEIAKLGTDDQDFVIGAVPVLKKTNHSAEASTLFDAGFKSVKATLDESPNDPHRLNNVAWLCAVCRERLDEAQALAEQASTLAPNDANILDTLAEVHIAQERVQDAIAAEQRAVRLQPQNAYLKRRLSEFEQAR